MLGKEGGGWRSREVALRGQGKIVGYRSQPAYFKCLKGNPFE
ncbi:hypothetical protein GEOBRER4_n2806 [Citrifermentans bremense]|uniref:Uncharacterized protein n=1 Tax=Citrifermentans bremense TaxID=60035 RepID=A0A7R7IYE0_9BACT|nr:hypothetical protein GEOBRER4_n2806 [Citrifermentans bremense]